MSVPRYFLGCESARAGNGGICRVARLVAKVLAGEAALRRGRAGGAVLSDADPDPALGVELRLARGSRAKFVAAVNAAALNHSHFIYDSGGMARAHQWLPLPRRPELVFLCGIEVWPGTAHPQQVRAAARADLCLAISEHTRARACHPRLAAAPVCWLATEDDRPPAGAKVTSGPPRVLILSRLDEAAYKGHAELIACWPAVRAAVPDAVLTVAGSGPAAGHYRKLASGLGLPAESVEFRGFIPEEELAELWSRTAVFAMPSRGEGFGLVYIEAMRHAVPVIASIHDAGPEVNLEGVTGFNVDLDRGDELTPRLVLLLRDRELAARLGANGAARWAEHFSFSAFRNRFVPILRGWSGG